jgi:hypothetical protein
MAWYPQVLLVPVLLLAFLGFQRQPRAGGIAAATVAAWCGLMIATYALKLVPMYAGHGTGPARMGDLLRWYAHEGAARESMLGTIALGPLLMIKVLLAATFVLGIALPASLTRRVVRS